MSLKITSLIGLGLSTVSFATWSGFAFKDNHKYNSKMWEYEEWRNKFFKKNLYDESTICKDKESCTEYKQYLPKPNEDELWKKAYKSLEENRKQDKQKNQITHNDSSKNEQLPNIKGFEDLKNYCYKEVKFAVDSNNKNYFDILVEGIDGKSHQRCVLSKKDWE